MDDNDNEESVIAAGYNDNPRSWPREYRKSTSDIDHDYDYAPLYGGGMYVCFS